MGLLLKSIIFTTVGGLVMCVAIRSIAAGINRWELVAGSFPHGRWKTSVEAAALREFIPRNEGQIDAIRE